MRDSDTARNAFEPLWKSDHVARLLNIPVKTVRAKTRTGEIPSVKIGKHRRYVPAQIRAMIEAASAKRAA